MRKLTLFPLNLYTNSSRPTSRIKGRHVLLSHQGQFNDDSCGTFTSETNGSYDVSVWVLLHLTPQLSSMAQSHIPPTGLDQQLSWGMPLLLHVVLYLPYPGEFPDGNKTNNYNKVTQLQQSDWHLHGQGCIHLILMQSLNLCYTLHILWIQGTFVGIWEWG